MKNFILPCISLGFMLSSCSDNIDKVSDGMCDCYNKGNVKFSSPTSAILSKLADSKDPLKTYTDALEKLSTTDQQKVQQDMIAASTVSEEQDVKACVQKLDETYKVRGNDEKTALKKVVAKMNGKGGLCQSWAGMINLGLQAQGSSPSSN